MLVPEKEVREQLAVAQRLAQQEPECVCATCHLLRTLAAVDVRCDRIIMKVDGSPKT